MQVLIVFENLVMCFYVGGCSLLFCKTMQRFIFCNSKQCLIFCNTMQCLFFVQNGAVFCFGKPCNVLFFFAKLCTVLFFEKGNVSHLLNPCYVFVYLKRWNVFFLQKVAVFFFVKLCNAWFSKSRNVFSFVKRSNLLLCKTMHCVPSTLAQSNTLTVSECCHILVQIPPAGDWLLWGSGCWGPLTTRQKQ